MTAREQEKDIAARFGRMVREQRVAAGLRQEDLALAAGVGRRFIIELEAGKHSCQLGRALRVAELVGIEFPGLPDPDPELPVLDDDYDPDDGDDRPEDDGMRFHEWIAQQS